MARRSHSAVGREGGCAGISGARGRRWLLVIKQEARRDPYRFTYRYRFPIGSNHHGSLNCYRFSNSFNQVSNATTSMASTSGSGNSIGVSSGALCSVVE